MKAIKNDIQIDHLKACHINDGIAMTKFMYWLKKNVGKIPMTERMISDHLEEERKNYPITWALVSRRSVLIKIMLQ